MTKKVAHKNRQTCQHLLPWSEGSFRCMICLYEGVPGAQDGGWGHVGAPGASVVGHKGPGPSP